MRLLDRLGAWPPGDWCARAGRIAHRAMKPLAWIAALAGACAAATYGLALVALQSLEPPGVRPGPRLGDARVTAGGTITVVPQPGGTARLAVGRSPTTIGGHEGTVVQALLVGGGREAVTVGEDGTVRLALVRTLHSLGLFDFSAVAGALDRRLWQPYGRPLADAALWATAQVLPLHVPEHARGRRGRSFRDCRGDFCGPEMVELEPGSFLMGSAWLEAGRNGDEGPRKLVTIGNPVAIGKFEVTFAEWDACVAADGCSHQPADEGWGRGRRPVVNVSWDHAKGYAAWLSAKTGQAYRLLTEAEWEYAARAGTATPFATGPTITTDQANFNGNFTYGGSAKGVDRQRTVEVGAFQPNGFSLHDMHGNVGEWVEDCYTGSYGTSPIVGSAVSSSGCEFRVSRGGSWYYNPQNHRSAARDRDRPDYRDSLLGFRLARTLSP